MNSYKLNGQSGYLARFAIAKGLKITPNDIYKSVKEINGSIITTYDNKEYILELKELTLDLSKVKNETDNK